MEYQHAKYAGNLGDVLKHYVHLAVLDCFATSAEQMAYYDTHAGAGAYQLSQASEAKHHNGIGQLWNKLVDKPPILKPQSKLITDYINLIQKFNAPQQLTHYPGSPWFAQQRLKSTSNITLFETNPQTFTLLKNNTQNDNRVVCLQDDGFAVPQKLSNNQAAYILIDPPYVETKEYQNASEAVVKLIAQSPNSCIALWYPLTKNQQEEVIIEHIRERGIANVTVVEIETHAKHSNMLGCGMLLVNIPEKATERINEGLEELTEMLASKNGKYRSYQLDV